MANLRLCTVLVLLAVVVAACYAQLTFTPAWGKRSNGQSNSNGAHGDGNIHGNGGGSSNMNFGGSSDGGCQAPSTDSLMLIHHIVQLEAQKLLECHAKDVNGF